MRAFSFSSSSVIVVSRSSPFGLVSFFGADEDDDNFLSDELQIFKKSIYSYGLVEWTGG